MKNSNKISCLLVIISLILVSIATPTTATYAEESTDEKSSNYSVNLSDYDYTVHITDKDMIGEIVEEYGLQSDEEIEEIIYVPILEDAFADDESGIATAEWGTQEFYVKKISSNEERGELLRSSWYEYPGGEMEICQSIETSISFSNETSLTIGLDVLETQLTLSYGFSVTQSIAFAERQTVIVNQGCKRNVKAYQNNMVYRYELWDEDLFDDDLIGTGEILKPVGVIFCMGGNMPLLT